MHKTQLELVKWCGVSHNTISCHLPPTWLPFMAVTAAMSGKVEMKPAYVGW